jgi:hypothetical protein
MDLVARVKGILLNPKDEWGKIKAEKTSIAQLFLGYAVVLAAIPAIATFIGFVLIRWPIGWVLQHAIIGYVIGLAATFGSGFIINAIAPSFGSKQNLENAMKLAVYSMTPGWIAGIFNIFTAINILAAIVSLYGLYILYLGFDHPIMETPKDKVMTYLVVSGVVIVVLIILTMAIVGLIAPSPYTTFLRGIRGL